MWVAFDLKKDLAEPSEHGHDIKDNKGENQKGKVNFFDLIEHDNSHQKDVEAMESIPFRRPTIINGVHRVT